MDEPEHYPAEWDHLKPDQRLLLKFAEFATLDYMIDQIVIEYVLLSLVLSESWPFLCVNKQYFRAYRRLGDGAKRARVRSDYLAIYRDSFRRWQPVSIQEKNIRLWAWADADYQDPLSAPFQEECPPYIHAPYRSSSA